MIRLAEPHDIDSLCDLLEELFGFEADFVANRVKQAKGLELLLQSDNSAVFVVEENYKVIGMATVQLIISTAEGGVAMHVEDVVITKIYRGKGLATKLLKNIGDWGRSKGASRMQLLADVTNSGALKFYETLGWKKTQLIALRKIDMKTE